MSSHKEAPAISNDAAADNTDVYAFVSPDKPDTVTLIANFVPLQTPAGGPNFFSFGDDVLYEIHIDNNGDAKPDITYQFRFRTVNTIPDTFLYNVGPIESITSKNWNRRQYYTVTRVEGGKSTTLGRDLKCPPVNVGAFSTSNYGALAKQAVHSLKGGGTVFAGQRAEGFYVDLGAIFDLGTLRPLQKLNAFNGMPASGGINATKALNINSIAIQVPKSDLTRGGYSAENAKDPRSTIGVYSTASRQATRTYADDGTQQNAGPFVQVSRLGNPLVNEVINPVGQKDKWNAADPVHDSDFADYVLKPELAGLLNVLYPGAFPKLAKYTKPRADLAAILLTGIPAGVVAGFQNFTGTTQADLLRLNMAIPPTVSKPSNLGLIGGDPAGFPNGRRVFDDVTTIELRAIAGATLPLVDKSYKPDAAAGLITQGLTSSNKDVNAENTVNYIYAFPYLGLPHGGYENP